MKFDPGLDIRPLFAPLGFAYGEDCFGPEAEHRRLDDIRQSLRDPHCKGPDIVYAIAMDVGKKEHRQLLQEMMLLFGVMTFSRGRLGDEPVRSQGHIHRISGHSGWSPPEIYEIWVGKAYIFMQERVEQNPGRCYAVYAEPGDVVIVPPGWAHATISADPDQPLTFGALCDREYGFEYEKIRARRGLSYYPVYNERNQLIWQPNNHYQTSDLIVKKPKDYTFLGLKRGVPLYRQFEEQPQTFQFVSKPHLKAREWENFVP